MASRPVNRRIFLQRAFAFSAAATLSGCARGISTMATSSQSSTVALTSVNSPAAQESADIMIIGDWGWSGDTSQSLVSTAMQSYVSQQGLNIAALLLLGDNWYGDLSGGAHSPRWQTQFEQMYPAEAFDCPAYAVLGNHDYQRWPDSKVDVELEYARINKTRWTMPARWYRFEFPKKHPLITFLALDSNMPYPDGSASKGKSFTLTLQQRTEQLAWLNVELQRPRTTPFLAVMAHHPVYTDGAHGDHPVLIRDWDPLFRKYDVHLYLAGHDHDLQHLEFEGHPTSFFLSGGGGGDLGNLKIEPSQRGPYAQKVYGFSHLAVTERAMTLRHLDSSGRILHAFTKMPDGRVAIL